VGFRGRFLCGYLACLALATGVVVTTLALTADQGQWPLQALTAGLLVALVGGWILATALVRQMVDPLEEIARSLSRVASGEPPVQLDPGKRRAEVSALTHAANALFNRMNEIAVDRDRTEALQSEMAVARRIQTSMLPRRLQAEGLEVAARTVAADEVGGDYYDVLPTPDGAWIGIGDVAGHGLPAGIIMLTVQSAISALTKDKPNATPKEILGLLNEVIYENIHHRLDVSDYVTLCLIRFFRDGRMVVAGAHEEIVVYRAKEARCEALPTEGTWIGVINDIRPFTTESQYQLHDGDLIVLFTDGVTEATTTKGVPFGFERLLQEVSRAATKSVDEIADHIVSEVMAWTPRHADDLSVVVLRYRAIDENERRL
jgi:phosphoserine phosphatase RsbU/P